MKFRVSEIRPILSKYRVLLAGHPMNTFDDTGSSYGERILDFPDNAELEPYTTYWSGSGLQLVTMGSFSYTGSRLPAYFEIGRYCSIAAGLKVMGNRHPLERVSTSPVFYTRALMAKTLEEDLGHSSIFTPFEYRPGKIVIGNDVWIGENVTLSHGISIGDGAVVASNAVVTKDVEPFTVVGGVPAKRIKYRFPIDVCTDLERSKWWEYSPQEVSKIDMLNVSSFARRFAALVKDNDLQKFKPETLTAQKVATWIRSNS